MKNLRLKTAMFTMIMTMMFIGSVFGQSTVIVDVNNNPVDSFNTRSVDINGNLDTSKIPNQYVNLIDTFKTGTVDRDTVTGTVIGGTSGSLVHNIPNNFSKYYIQFNLDHNSYSYDLEVDTNSSANKVFVGDNFDIDPTYSRNILISGNSNITYSVTSGSGYYDVISIVYHIRDTIFVNSMSTGIKTIDKPTFDANVYPNPSNGRFNISFENSVNRVEIFNTSGQVVKQFRPYSNTEQVDLSNMSRGVYYVRYYRDNIPSLAKKMLIK